MNGKLYIKKFIRDDGETLSFDAEEIYLSENNTLLVRSDPATTAVEFTEEDGGEMIRQRGATYSQPVSGLIVPKSTEYWALCVRLSRFFILNHTYKIVYIKRDGSMFSMNRAWINAGLQIVPVPYENYSTWTIEFRIGDNFWTEYAEDSQGKEIYSNSVELPLLTAGTGGEVWSDVTQQTLSGLGDYFAIDGTSISASINELEVRGDTFQQTYSGKNLYNMSVNNRVSWSNSLSEDESGWITATGYNGFYNFWTRPNMNLVTGATYYYVLEVKEVYAANASDHIMICNGTSTASANKPQFVDDADLKYTDLQAGGIYVGSIIAASDFSNANNMLRSWCRPYDASSKLVFRLTIMSTQPSTSTFVYEPYVGGIPAPNPDYPQGIQVVTGEQTVKVSGKNLFDKNTVVLYNGYFSAGGSIAGDNFSDLTRGTDRFFYIPCEPNTTYSITKPLQSTASYNRFRVGTQSVLNITNGATLNDYWRMSDGGTTTAYTITTGTNANYLFVYFAKATTATSPGGEVQEVLDGLQIEKSSTATAYEPYQSQSYTISLGSLELYKIGDYQDYIHKSGGGWYVHKACGKQTVDTSSIALRDTYTNVEYAMCGKPTDYGGYGVYGSAYPIVCTHAIHSSNPGNWNSASNIGHLYSGAETYKLWIGFAKGTGLDAIKTKLAGCINYYALGTPTDTQITDATLVAQLNTLAGAQAYNSKTVYQTDSATMPAILSVELLQSVGGGETWDNVGAVWEEGVGGVQTINVETTQTTYPVWTVTGPCSNPTLQNDTTDTIASFDGMIASGQTLTVNFADNTAYLDSAPVAKYVSGYVSLAPGENVIGFNSDGGSTQTSTISWDNIIN